MPARRFFVEHVHAVGDGVTFAGSDAHKITSVLRLRTGDRIEVVDSGGTLFDAQIRGDGDAVRAVLEREIERGNARVLSIDVAQGIPKGAKMDFVVEKLTELGVRTIIPFEGERTVVRDIGEAKLERWRRLARAAAQQSGRLDVPSVAPSLSFAQLCETFERYDVVLFPWEAASGEPLRDTLPALINGARSVLVVIGPEGGISHDEATCAQNRGAKLVSLGRRILRTETAGLFVLAILDYLSS